MAAQAWKAYNEALRKIGANTLPLNSTAFRITLHKSTSNAATLTLSIYNEVTNEVTEQFGYSSSGKALTGEAWTVGTSGGQYKFDADDPIWTATGGNITSIMFAVIWLSAAASANRHLLCFASLSSAAFAISTGNTLTIQMAAAGILTLARG